MARAVARPGAAAPPQWIAPQLTQLVDAAPDGDAWLYEIKFDGYRMHARLDTRQAYLDGELCGVGPDGITSFSMIRLDA